MLCVYRGSVCYLKYNITKGRWVYIQQDKWQAMSAMERYNYADSESEARAMMERE